VENDENIGFILRQYRPPICQNPEYIELLPESLHNTSSIDDAIASAEKRNGKIVDAVFIKDEEEYNSDKHLKGAEKPVQSAHPVRDNNFEIYSLHGNVVLRLEIMYPIEPIVRKIGKRESINKYERETHDIPIKNEEQMINLLAEIGVIYTPAKIVPRTTINKNQFQKHKQKNNRQIPAYEKEQAPKQEDDFLEEEKPFFKVSCNEFLNKNITTYKEKINGHNLIGISFPEMNTRYSHE
jgi:hypothetical protein